MTPELLATIFKVIGCTSFALACAAVAIDLFTDEEYLNHD